MTYYNSINKYIFLNTCSCEEFNFLNYDYTYVRVIFKKQNVL